VLRATFLSLSLGGDDLASRRAGGDENQPTLDRGSLSQKTEYERIDCVARNAKRATPVQGDALHSCKGNLVLLVGIEPTTYALPRRCATTTLQQLRAAPITQRGRGGKGRRRRAPLAHEKGPGATPSPLIQRPIEVPTRPKRLCRSGRSRPCRSSRNTRPDSSPDTAGDRPRRSRTPARREPRS
jgi:hypothetical protein